MGVDAKDIGTLLWKILRISTNSVYTCVRKYPIVSGVSTVIFLLYTFLPRLFFFFLFSSPFIAFAAFYLRNHLNLKPLNGLSSPFTQNGSEEGGTQKADLKHQKSVRRNARRKVEEVGKDWDSSQASEDERDKVILTTLYGEFPNNTRESPKLQKFHKDRTFLVSEETSSTTGNVSEMITSGGGETEVECSSSSSSSEGEEETIPEDKKVVTWTEDDQKNLMDLGNSDIERNKRLEHLLTRRRTRRFTDERSLMDMDVPSISVGRNYFGLDEENYMIDGIQIPESAPSVLLLPTKNPFDLPQEEKPNLPESDTMESERRTEIVVSDEKSLEMDSSVSNQADSSGTLVKRNGEHRVGNSLVGVVPRNTGSLSSSLAAERQKYMEHFGYSTNKKGHKMTQSVESDLQVEFSEIGSPPTTVDGNNSSDDDEKPLLNGEGNEAKQESIVDITAESEMLPVEKSDQDLNETSSILYQETDAAKQFEGVSDGKDVNGRSEEEERSESRHSLLENSDRGLHLSDEEPLRNSVDEMKISYVFDEPEPEASESRTNQELEDHVRRNDEGQSMQEVQELAEPEVSNVNQVASDASATSPTSVLPDMSLPLDRTNTLASEDLEPIAVIPEPDAPENQFSGYSRNSRETEGQSEVGEEAIEEDSTSDFINTQHETPDSAVTEN